MNRGALIDHADRYGCTPLHSLWLGDSPFSRTDFVTAMLTISNVTILSPCKDIWRPEVLAAKSGSAEDIAILEKLGANLYKLNDWGRGIMHHCLQNSNLAIFNHFAPRMVKDWIHEFDNRVRTPLHYLLCRSLEKPKSELAERLIRAGADVHARDIQGRSAFDYAKDNDLRCKKWRDERLCQNVAGYVRALRACDYDVQIDEEGDILWLAES